MSAEPLVSVVMATRNAGRFLDTALTSVRSQSFQDLEIVVVDKDSTDDTREIAEAHDVRFLEQRGTGYAGAWNEGVEAARGELIAFLDSDDRWEQGKLEAQVRLLGERDDLAYAIGMVRFFLEEGMPLPPGFKPELLGSDHVAHMPGALLIRRSAFDAVGPLRTDMDIANDIDWFARLKDAGMLGEVAPGALTHKRLHDTNLSHFSAQNMNREIVGLLRESVQRQRGAR